MLILVVVSILPALEALYTKKPYNQSQKYRNLKTTYVFLTENYTLFGFHMCPLFVKQRKLR